VTFGLSHVNLMINKDILVKNTQIFIYFNYSLKLVSRAKTSKEKKWREYFAIYIILYISYKKDNRLYIRLDFFLISTDYTLDYIFLFILCINI